LFETRQLTGKEQKDADEMREIYDKILDHCEKIEYDEISDSETLKIEVPARLNKQFKLIMKSIWDGKYVNGEFRYVKYGTNKYRDGGCGPHWPKWPGDNEFKFVI
jgi:hypothetical protein